MDPHLIAHFGLPKLRLFHFARELKLSPTDVVKAAADIGIHVKNSALATVTYEERDAIAASLGRRTEGKP